MKPPSVRETTPPAMRALRLTGAAVAWGVMMATSAALALVFDQGRALDSQVATIAAIYFAGAILAFPVSVPPVLALTARYARPVRLIAIAVALALATLALTAAALALQYRAYYAQWHDPALSRVWFLQQFYTALGSTYQYAVIGIRLYWPAGPLFLAATTWWVSRRPS